MGYLLSLALSILVIYPEMSAGVEDVFLAIHRLLVICFLDLSATWCKWISDTLNDLMDFLCIALRAERLAFGGMF